MELQFTYVDNVNSNLICCICRMPFVRPMVTTTCSHTFCNHCIIAALSISLQCPVDRSPLEEIDLQPANPIVRSLVDELVVECINREHGCSHTCQRQFLAAHLRDQCEFVQVLCREKECQKLMSRKNIEKHISSCQHRVVSCRGCGDQVTAAYIEEHHENCHKREISCPHCKVVYPSGEIDLHEASCPDVIVGCNQAVHGCPWSGARHTLSSHTNQCSYESIKDFLSLNSRRISFLEAENLSLRNQIEALETALRLVHRDIESTRVVLGPWFTQEERSGAIRSPPPSSSPAEPASRAFTQNPSNAINPNTFGFSSSSLSSRDTSTYNAPPSFNPNDLDPLSYFFPPESIILDAPLGHVGPIREGMYRQTLSSSIAPLNLSTSLVGSLGSLQSSLVTLASSLESEVRRHDIALTTESSRVSEEVMALRAIVHGLRMQVHQIIMDRNSQVTGNVEGDIGPSYNHPQISSVGDFGFPSRYLHYGHPLYRQTNYGTSHLQPTKL